MSAETIGVRDLQQHASRYLELVQAGQVIEVTRHGRRIARLVPAADPGDPHTQFYAAGLLVPPAEPGGLLDLVAVPPPPDAPSAQQIFDEEREDRL
jgi:prevent-host-death family protein